MSFCDSIILRQYGNNEMKKIGIILSSMMMFLSLNAHAETYIYEKDKIDSYVMKHILESDKPVLVEFSEPWCGPCKLLAPKLVELGNDQKNFDIFILDDAPRQMLKYYNIQAFPVLLRFSDGKPEIRYGELPMDAIIKWMAGEIHFNDEPN